LNDLPFVLLLQLFLNSWIENACCTSPILEIGKIS